MGSSSKPPAPPQISPEERELLNEQKLTLTQARDLLNKEGAQSDQVRQVLQGVSGFYNEDGTVNESAITDFQDRLNSRVEQQDALNNLGQQVLGRTFDETELDKMFSEGFNFQSADSAAQAFNSLSGDVGQLEKQRLTAALNGDLPPSSGILQSEKRDFAKLKEAAGQRGIKLDGDDPFTATSQSTAGNQTLADFRQASNVRRDQERQFNIQQGTQANLSRLGLGLNLGQLGLSSEQANASSGLGLGNLRLAQQGQQYGQAQGLQANDYLQQLQFATQQGNGAQLAQGYGNLAQGYGAAADPYTQQRMLEYQRQLQGSSNRNSLLNSGIGLAGTLGGAYIGSLGGPAGTVVGSQVGNEVFGKQSMYQNPTSLSGFAS